MFEARQLQIRIKVHISKCLLGIQLLLQFTKSYARHLIAGSFKRSGRDDFLQIMPQLYQHLFPISPVIGIVFRHRSWSIIVEQHCTPSQTMVFMSTPGCNCTEQQPSHQIILLSQRTFCSLRQAMSPWWHLRHWHRGAPAKLLHHHEAISGNVSPSNSERLWKISM